MNHDSSEQKLSLPELMQVQRSDHARRLREAEGAVVFEYLITTAAPSRGGR